MAIGPLAKVESYQNRQEEENRHRYFGEYLGFVRDNKDPQKLGRVRVHVPAILGEENNEDHWLDWCSPKSAGLFVPAMNAPVTITFEQGYATHGHYTHGWILGEDANSSKAPLAGKGELDPTWLDELSVAAGGTGPQLAIKFPKDSARDDSRRPQYPHNKVFESESGFVVELDDSPSAPRARLYHPAGTTILLDIDGSIHIVSAGAMHFRSGGDINMTLGQGGTFRALYPGGTGLQVGHTGFHVTGHAASILDRTVERIEKNIR